MKPEAKPSAVPSAEASPDWWRGAAIYQVYPRSFADSNGDGVGDLPGVTAKLDYLASLGVDAVWLSPFFKSPMRDFGYDVSDYRDVDPIFGTLKDFDALIERAHGLGLKVIIDQVYSHTSDQHAWFRESRRDRENAKADWYVWADAKPDGSPPNNWQSVFGGPAWTWDSRRRQYYLHNFLPEQPDLNVHAAAVQDALVDTARFWFARGVDGFRLDAINFAMHDPSLRDNPPAPPGKRTRPFDFQQHLYNQSHADIPVFLRRLRALADEFGGRMLVAEVGGDDSDREMKLFTEPPSLLHSAYGFQFLYAPALDGDVLRQALNMWSNSEKVGWPAWAFSNHDAPRAISRWAHGRDRKLLADLLLYLLVCLRGTIFIYQGEELGLPQAEVPFERLRDPEAIVNWPLTLGRDGARTPMPWSIAAPYAGFSMSEPWLPIDPRHRDLAVEAQEADLGSTLHAARRALKLREKYPSLRAGALELIETAAPLFAFQRGEGPNALLCVFNLGDAAAAWSPPAGWRVIETLHVDSFAGVLPPLSCAIAQKS